MKIINKTGRTIALYINNIWQTFFPEGSPVILKESLQPYSSAEVQISKYTYSGLINLPDKQQDVIIVVDKDIALKCWQMLRDDVVYMHAPAVRDDKYRSVASITLVCWTNAFFS